MRHPDDDLAVDWPKRLGLLPLAQALATQNIRERDVGGKTWFRPAKRWAITRPNGRQGSAPPRPATRQRQARPSIHLDLVAVAAPLHLVLRPCVGAGLTALEQFAELLVGHLLMNTFSASEVRIRLSNLVCSGASSQFWMFWISHVAQRPFSLCFSALAGGRLVEESLCLAETKTGPRVVPLGDAAVQEQPALLAEAIVVAYALSLEPGQALHLERRMTCVAAAAEELGQCADPEALVALAQQFEARLT